MSVGPGPNEHSVARAVMRKTEPGIQNSSLEMRHNKTVQFRHGAFQRFVCHLIVKDQFPVRRFQSEYVSGKTLWQAGKQNFPLLSGSVFLF